MSPVGNAFRERLRKFPSLVNCCTIDWCVDGHMITTQLNTSCVSTSFLCNDDCTSVMDVVGSAYLNLKGCLQS
jgi:hypothetical protein